ncbi:4Fe-4S binding protein [Dehalobacter sp. 14DCB1]|uniref:4Fe-4S binding protein n=1 Tax=Dehalobacter sp. 14DCB1 TaxID=2070227 RepID=UPI001A9B83D8|nr:4Fe-4S binding protein [Dehalobacter sp. 14DCB1]
MKRKKRDFKSYYLLILFFTAIAAIIYGVCWTAKTIDYSALIKQNIPDVTSIGKIVGTQRAYKVDALGKQYYAVCDSAVGYQSRIETMTIVTDDGLVEKVIVTRQGETPVFFDRLYSQKFFEQFQGLSLREPIYLGGAYGYSGYLAGTESDNYVDRVTGSTVSSHAVAEAVNNGTSYIASQCFNTKWVNPYDTYQLNGKDIAMITVFLIALAAAHIKRLAHFRFWWLLASTVMMGFVVDRFVTASNLFSIITLQIPHLTNVGWYVLIAGSLGFILFLGKNLYCAWICPFGAVQEFLNRAAGFKSLGISPQVTKTLRLAAPTILWAAIMLGTWVGDYGALDYQPFSALFLFKAVWMMWLILPIMVFINLFVNRFYCQFFCPVGFLFNLLSRWRNNGVRVWNQIWNRTLDQLKSSKS